jgi:hypothetical protein
MALPHEDVKMVLLAWTKEFVVLPLKDGSSSLDKGGNGSTS